MVRIFYGATAFNQDIGEWVVSLVKNMHGMFYDAAAFNQNLCSWDTQAAADNNNLMFYDSKCSNKDNPSVAAKCQPCERRRLTATATATATAINAAGKPNKPATNNIINNNNNNDRNKNSKAKGNIVTGRVLQEDATVAATAAAATATVSSEFDISIGVSKSDNNNNNNGVDSLRTAAAAGYAPIGKMMTTTIALISLFGGLIIGSAVLFF